MDSVGGGGDQLGLLCQGKAILQRTDRGKISRRDGFNYGQTPGQIGKLKAGDLKAIVKKDLQNTTADDSMVERSKNNETIEIQQTIEHGKKRGLLGGMEGPQGSTTANVRSGGDVTDQDCEPLLNPSKNNPESVSGFRDRTERKGPGRERALFIHGREIERDLSGEDSQREVSSMQNNEEFGDPSQRLRPLQQRTGEPSDFVCVVSHEPAQEKMVGSKKGGFTTSKKQRNCGLDSIITSPPYADQGVCNRNGIDESKLGKHGPHSQALAGGYGHNPSNIGNLKMDGIVTSPPWENQIPSQEGPEFHQQRESIGKNNSIGHGRYGESPGQIDQDQAETYWTAMRTVYAECHKALKPGGYLICVVKAYVKNKKRVPLPQQTLKLLIRLRFEPVERIKAMLTKESVNGGLFGEDIVSKKERKSFFRRLAEKKGSPRIDFEEILVVRK